MQRDQTAHWVVAIDPGLVTGWAALPVTGDPSLVPAYGEIPDRYDVAQHVRNMASSGVALTIVTERFTIFEDTATKTPQYDALYINGWLEIEAHHNGWGFFMQNPGEAKRFATNSALRALGWYFPTKDGHQNDGIRHLVTHLVNHYRQPGQVGFLIANRILEGAP